VLHVVPTHGAEPRGTEQHDRRRSRETDLDLSGPSDDPGDDRPAAPPQPDDHEGGHGEADEEAADLDPLRQAEEEAQHRGHAAW